MYIAMYIAIVESALACCEGKKLIAIFITIIVIAIVAVASVARIVR